MELLRPGIFLDEVAGTPPVEGVATSTAAFVGVAKKGAIAEAVLVTSWGEFVKKFGSYITNSYLAYAVRGFFENGGTRAYISRVVHFSAGAKTSIASFGNIIDTTVTPVNIVKVEASSDGVWGDSLTVEISDYNATDETFTLTVKESGIVVETFEALTLATIDDVINGSAQYIKVTVLDATKTIKSPQTVALAGGNDGLTSIADSDYVGASDTKNGLYAFDSESINILAVPGIATTTVVTGIVTYVEGRKDCSAIIETPIANTVTQAKTYKQTTANVSSERVAIYYPWIKVSDPIGIGKSPLKTVPPSGHLAGIYARIDNSRGVFKAPAGTEAKVLGAVGLEYAVTDAEQDILNPIGVNAIRTFPGDGIVVWGARMTNVKSEYKYVPVRRSVDYVEQSLIGGTRWSVFEPNDATLWGKLKMACEAFLRGYWRAGGLKGTTEAEAFYVVCDSSTTTEDDIDAGRVYADIGLSPQKPAEFIIFRVSLR